MKSVKQLLEGKTRSIASVAPSDTVFHALEVLAKYDVGALLVLDQDKLAGIFSERDYARKVILLGKASKDIPVSQIMTAKVICVTPERTVEDCMAIMTEKHIRHLPVVEDGDPTKVIGIISIGDVVKWRLEEMERESAALRDYIRSA